MAQENNKQSLTPPIATIGDHVHSDVKAALQLIPNVGGSLAELFDQLIGPPLRCRLESWRQIMAERLVALERDYADFKLRAVVTDQMFLSVFMHSAQIASRTHQEEKLEALRNAVLNSALPNNLEADLQFMFLSLVDSVTPTHLRVLQLLSKSELWGDWGDSNRSDRSPGNIYNVINYAFVELRERRDLSEKVVRDLMNGGLIDAMPSPHNLINGRPVKVEKATALGRQFLQFIAPPKRS